MEQKLETFLTLCQTLHYGRAAERLHLSQPAVSKQIQSLERITASDCSAMTAGSSPKHHRASCLSAMPSAFATTMPSCSAHSTLHRRPVFASAQPSRSAITSSSRRSAAFCAIRRMNWIFWWTTPRICSLCWTQASWFCRSEGIFVKCQYDSFLFRPEPYIGVCAADHPFAGREVSLSELFDERLILRESGSGTRKILERELSQLGYTTEMFRATICIRITDCP